MGYNSVPPRWDEYSKMGRIIPGTQIIPFKVPLRKEICANLHKKSKSFTTDDLLSRGKALNLSLVIDLTMTTRFYCCEDLQRNNVEYVKFAVMGGGNMPREFEVSKFCSIISEHLRYNPTGVIGVHCTHGLNRTGYFICRYMIDCLGFPGPYAVKSFEKCRGHVFDRENYREFLSQRMPLKIRMPPPEDNESDIYDKFSSEEEASVVGSSNKDERSPQPETMAPYKSNRERKREYREANKLNKSDYPSNSNDIFVQEEKEHSIIDSEIINDTFRKKKRNKRNRKNCDDELKNVNKL